MDAQPRTPHLTTTATVTTPNPPAMQALWPGISNNSQETRPLSSNKNERTHSHHSQPDAMHNQDRIRQDYEHRHHPAAKPSQDL
jgi:hypothetical protein